MRKSVLAVTVLGVVGGAYIVYRAQQPRERRDRWARRLMNERIAPVLLERGVADGEHAEIGVVEHVGRVSRKLRRTLVHPIPLGDRFALPLAYGEGAEWPKNVLAAGACRLQYRGRTFGLCNPRPMAGDEIEGLPRSEAVIGKAFGSRFLVLDVSESESVAPLTD